MAAPRGLGSFFAMLFVARMINRIDPRIMIFSGMAIGAASLWMMSGFNLQMDKRPMFIAYFVQGLGMGLTYVPIMIIGFATIAGQLRTPASVVLTLARNLGGSIGISIVTTVLARSIQTSHSDLASQITPASTPAVDPALLGMAGESGQTAIAMLDAEINRQAAMIGYINDFYMMMIAIIVALPLVFLLKLPKSDSVEKPIVVD
jgi:DHA2 family multidrug resistance protein